MSAEAYVAQFLHNVITHNAEILQPLMISDEEGLQSMITHAIELSVFQFYFVLRSLKLARSTCGKSNQYKNIL